MTTMIRRTAVLVLAFAAAMPLLSVKSGSASGMWADAGPYATARFGTCSGSSTAYVVSMFYPGGYAIFRQQVVGGKCKTTLSDYRPSSGASVFTWTPTKAEFIGPSDLGTLHVVWTATSALPDPVSGSGPWFSDPTTPLSSYAGVWGEVEQPTTARGWIPSASISNAAAAASYIAVGGGGGIYS